MLGTGVDECSGWYADMMVMSLEGKLLNSVHLISGHWYQTIRLGLTCFLLQAMVLCNYQDTEDSKRNK
jgi:hypothetical protein